MNCRPLVQATLCVHTRLLVRKCERTVIGVVEPDEDADKFKVDRPKRFSNASPEPNAIGMLTPGVARHVRVPSLAQGLSWRSTRGWRGGEKGQLSFLGLSHGCKV